MDPFLNGESIKTSVTYRGVDKFFKTLAKLASSSVFSLAKSESNWQKNRKDQ
jgi:hypothetical protein